MAPARPPTGPRASGELIDVSGGGVAVGFSLNVDPKLEVGLRCQLTVSSASHGQVLMADAVLASRTLIEKQLVRYGFEFSDPQGLLESASPTILSLLNRRSDLRIRPALGTHLVATLHCGPTQSFEVEVQDLSSNGVGFIVNEFQGSLLSAFNFFDVEMRIPRTKTAIRWRAVVLHSTQLPRGGTLYGLVFDQVPGGDYERERKALVEYCQERSADMSRWALE